jgi:hypothetical protein
VDTLCILYAKYAVLRDIFTQHAPSTSPGEEYRKWLELVDKWLKEIEDGLLELVDTNGVLIEPANAASKTKVGTTTPSAKRIFSHRDAEHWNVNSNNYDSSVIGEGGADTEDE